MDTTTATPLQIDTQLAELFAEMARADSARDAALTLAHRAAGDKQVRGYGRRAAWGMTDEAAIAAIAELDTDLAGIARRDLERAVARMAAAEAQAEPLHAEYARRPWSRFFSVPGGHIHKDNRLSCNRRPDTDQRWNPALSGKSEAEAVEALGPNMCTVCFPSAPVEWTAGTPRKSREQVAAERAEAEKAARVNDPKLIAAPDGRPLRVDGNVLRTVRSAEIAAVDALWWAAYGRHLGEPNEPFARSHEANAAQIVAALAAKAGTTEAAELARLTDKAIKKIRKELGADVAAAASAVWGR
jgi:hypothetical protein